jgi:hypothetical protein
LMAKGLVRELALDQVTLLAHNEITLYS